MSLVALLLRGSLRTALLATLAGILSGASLLGMIVLIHAGLGRPTPVLAWSFAGLCLTALAARVGSQMLLVRLSQETVSRLSRDLCRKVLDTPLAQLEEIGPHRVQAVLTGDVQVIALALNGIPAVCVNVTTLACGLAYLGWLSPPVVAAALVFLTLGVASYRLAEATAFDFLRRARDEQDRWMKHLRSLIHGVKELKLHAGRRRAFLDETLAGTVASFRALQTAGQTIHAAAVTWGRMLFFVAIGLLVFVLPGTHPLDARTVGGATLTILYMTGPVESIMGWLPALGRARISVRKVQELGLSLEPGHEELPAGDRPAPAASWSRLELADVTRSYRGDRDEHGFLLGPIDLALHPGEVVFVVGGNGSGKTTLIKRITGLYAPEGGAIRLDGREVLEPDREHDRQLFSAVFAEANLFESLVGLDAPDLDAQARDYLAQLHLDHKVGVERGVFSTTALSKGQRKRLALVTAYLEDRPIYVFDEWAADQDPHFKGVFYHQIRPELRARGKCVVAVTHDEGYLAAADRIVRLRDGKIIDETWDYDRQSLGESLAGPA